jgi:hypothetical protein
MYAQKMAPHLVVALSVAMLHLCSCSDDQGAGPCPPCAEGMVCDDATATCVPDTSCAAACGANTFCGNDGSCACKVGWGDCNGNLGQAGSDGCECPQDCTGGSCKPIQCLPNTANACGNDQMFCSQNICTSCLATTYNCDGVNDCESFQPCQSQSCDPLVPNACGSNTRHCKGGMCSMCQANTFNCDGVQDCECNAGCTGNTCASGICDPSCVAVYDFLCVRDPNLDQNPCVACIDASHCEGNPRANGTICDSSLCVCVTNNDCTNRTTGPKCLQSGNIKLCGCETPADCPPDYPLCVGELGKQCLKPCQSDLDCTEGYSQGVCNTESGLCEYWDE